MFRAMVVRWHAPKPYFGVGDYYRRDGDDEFGVAAWIPVTLAKPLMLDARKIRMLIERYRTDAPEPAAALAGAWQLRRDILQTGHDGVVAVETSAHNRCVIIVDFVANRDGGGGDGPPQSGIRRANYGVIAFEAFASGPKRPASPN